MQCDTLAVCAGCGTQVKQLLSHLSKKNVCQTFYDMESLRRNAKERTREKNQQYKQRNKEKVSEYQVIIIIFF